MSETIRPIETRYKGCRFRSRLEARYAVLFDALKMRWQYEPEGFELGNGERYLPDFWCPFNPKDAAFCKFKNPGTWIEIKPTLPDECAIQKLAKVCRTTKHHGVILCGPPDENMQAVSISNSGKHILSDLGLRLDPNDPDGPAQWSGRFCLMIHLHRLTGDGASDINYAADHALSFRFENDSQAY
jgi:hypothetical protein